MRKISTKSITPAQRHKNAVFELSQRLEIALNIMTEEQKSVYYKALQTRLHNYIEQVV